MKNQSSKRLALVAAPIVMSLAFLFLGSNNCMAQLLDSDGDGVVDSADDCLQGEAGWVSGPATDHDADGCRDATEDVDDDNDGYPDSSDLCPIGEIGWVADATSDWDSDGCLDATEDLDDDNDGVPDAVDACPRGDIGWTSNPDTDADADGCRDSTGEDLDDDNDGVDDSVDFDPLNPFVCADTDADTCDDCSIEGFVNPANDGPDNDGDGICDAGEPPPPTMSCLDSALVTVKAAQKYQRAAREVVNDCGRKDSPDCYLKLISLDDAFNAIQNANIEVQIYCAGS